MMTTRKCQTKRKQSNKIKQQLKTCVHVTRGDINRHENGNFLHWSIEENYLKIPLVVTSATLDNKHKRDICWLIACITLAMLFPFTLKWFKSFFSRFYVVCPNFTSVWRVRQYIESDSVLHTYRCARGIYSQSSYEHVMHESDFVDDRVCCAQ